MFCKNCGKELSENAYICPDCGEPVSQSVVNQNIIAQTKNTVTDIYEPKKYVFAVLGFSCAMIAIVFAILYLVFNMITDLSFDDLYSYTSTSYSSYTFYEMGYDVAAAVTTGLITNLIAFAGLLFSITGLCLSEKGNSKEKALTLTGIIVSAVIMATLIACYCVCAVY